MLKPQVGVRRFELPAPTSLTWCANRTALHPDTSWYVISNDRSRTICSTCSFVRQAGLRSIFRSFSVGRLHPDGKISNFKAQILITLMIEKALCSKTFAEECKNHQKIIYLQTPVQNLLCIGNLPI